MKILIIRNYPSYMDVVNNTYNIQELGLAKALVRKKNKCDIVFWTDKKEKTVDIPVDYCGTVKVFYKKGITFLKNTVYLSCNTLFEEYDILQLAEYNQALSWILAKKYPKKVIIYHGPYFSEFNKRYNLICSFFDIFFLRRYLKLRTPFIVKSQLAKDFLRSKGIKEENICVGGVGIDTQMLSSDSKGSNIPFFNKMAKDSNKKVLYIGRLEERRNIKFILDVFKLVLDKYPNTTLYMIGTGEQKYVNSVWNRADELHIKNRIVYEPKVEQKFLSKIYQMSDIFILPTIYEIFGMVLLEAMYYENAALTSINGGSSTLIENNKNGVIFNEFKPQEWSDKILELFNSEDLLQSIKEKAHETVSNFYTWDSLADKFLKEYKKIDKENS